MKTNWNPIVIAQHAVSEGRSIRVETLEWINRRYDTEYIITADSHLSHADDCQYCELTDETYSEHAEFLDYVGRDGWRETNHSGEADAVEARCFYCDWSDEWFLSTDFTSVEVGMDCVCFERHQDRLYYWESDGGYHTEPEPEPEEEEIPSYHSSANDSFKARAKHMRGAGVELETWAEEPTDWYEHVSSHRDLCGEEDPSLASGKSLEVITVPHTLEDWRSGNVDLFRALSSYSGKLRGHDAGEDYGIHVSLSRVLFPSDLVLGKYVVAVNQMASIGQAIAQRVNAYNGGFKVRSSVSRSISTGKYEPVKIESRRVETRIFRANLKPERIQAKVQYCFAVLAWVQTASCVTVSNEESASHAFLSWLALPGNRQAFPHLCDMLAEQAAKLNAISRDAVLLAHRLKRKAYRGSVA